MGTFVAILLPMPFSARKKLFTFLSTSPIVAKIAYALKIAFVYVFFQPFPNDIRAERPAASWRYFLLVRRCEPDAKGKSPDVVQRRCPPACITGNCRIGSSQTSWCSRRGCRSKSCSEEILVSPGPEIQASPFLIVGVPVPRGTCT